MSRPWQEEARRLLAVDRRPQWIADILAVPVRAVLQIALEMERQAHLDALVVERQLPVPPATPARDSVAACADRRHVLKSWL